MNKQEWLDAQVKASDPTLQISVDGDTFDIWRVSDWKDVLTYKSVIFDNKLGAQIGDAQLLFFSANPTEQEVEDKIKQAFGRACMEGRSFDGKIYDTVPSSFAYGQWR